MRSFVRWFLSRHWFHFILSGSQQPLAHLLACLFLSVCLSCFFFLLSFCWFCHFTAVLFSFCHFRLFLWAPRCAAVFDHDAWWESARVPTILVLDDEHISPRRFNLTSTQQLRFGKVCRCAQMSAKRIMWWICITLKGCFFAWSTRGYVFWRSARCSDFLPVQAAWWGAPGKPSSQKK